MIQSLYISGTIPSLNKLSSASVITTRTGKKITKYGQSKKAWTTKVMLRARGKLKPVASAYFTFVHFCTDRRTDPDNFCGVAQKVALDGLKKAKVIPNDGWEQVLGLAHYWVSGGKPGFAIVMSGGPLSAGEAWEQAERVRN